MTLLEIGYRDTGRTASRPPMVLLGTPGVKHFVRMNLENDEAAKVEVESRTPAEIVPIAQAAGHVTTEAEHVQTPADAAGAEPVVELPPDPKD